MNHLQRDNVLKEAFSYQSKLIAYAYSMLRNHSSAEDIVQNSYLVIVQKYEQFEAGTSMIAWCRAIVRLQALNYIKRHKKVIPLEDQILNDAVDAAFESCQSIDDSPKHEHLRECMSKLPHKSLTTIQLRYMDKLGYDAIGSTLGIKLEAVRKGLFRAKQKLKDCMESKLNLENIA